MYHGAQRAIIIGRERMITQGLAKGVQLTVKSLWRENSTTQWKWTRALQKGEEKGGNGESDHSILYIEINVYVYVYKCQKYLFKDTDLFNEI